MYYYSRAWYVIGSDWWVSSNNTWEWLSPIAGHIFHSLVHFHSASAVLSILSGISFNISFILYHKFSKVLSPVICEKKFPQDFPDYTHGHLQAVLFHVVPNLGSHCAFWEEISKNIGNMYRIWTCVCGHTYVDGFNTNMDNQCPYLCPLFLTISSLNICMKWCKIVLKKIHFSIKPFHRFLCCGVSWNVQYSFVWLYKNDWSNNDN